MTTLVERDLDPLVIAKMDLEPPFVAIPIDNRPTTHEVHAEVHRIVEKAMERARPHGSLPNMRSSEWLSAPIEVKIAAILVLGEAYLLCDPQRQAMEMVRDVSSAFSSSHNWSNSIPNAELVRRRSELGPTAALVDDPASAARWVVTGRSEELTV